MSDFGLSLCRSMMKEAHKLVKKNYPRINLHKAAWVRHFHRDSWEFHGPDKYYWNGRAANSYDARYKGWMAWLESKGHGV